MTEHRTPTGPGGQPPATAAAQDRGVPGQLETSAAAGTSGAITSREAGSTDSGPGTVRGLLASPALLPAAFTLVAFVLYTALSWVMWSNTISPSWDLGIFTQLAKAYGNLEAPIVDIKGDGYNLLGDHFHPILVLLGPFYALFPSGSTLLIIQAALFAVSAWPVVSLAQERLGKPAAALLGGSYVFSWGLLNAVWAQFHEIAFAVPLLAFGLVWWIRGRTVPAIIAISLLVFVKEDLGLTVAAVGAAFYLRERTDRNLKTGVFLAVWGIVWFVLSTMVILPALNPQGQWDYTDNLSLLDQVMAGAGMKILILVILALSAGVIGLKSPLVLIMVPTLAWRFVGNVDYYWGWEFHYSGVLIPVAAISLSDVATERWRTVAPLIAFCTSLVMLPQTEIDLLWDHEGYVSDSPGAIEAASQYDIVAADISLLAYLVPHTNVYWYGTLGDVEPDAIAVNWWRLGEPAEPWAEERFGGDWDTIYSEDRWEVIVPAE